MTASLVKSEPVRSPYVAPALTRKLVLENVQKTYGKRTVVKGVNLAVAQGEIVGLLGPNGAGKTTTFYMATGLVKPDVGKVSLDDADITGVPMYRRARQGIGYLAQEASIFRNLSVRDNLRLVMEQTGGAVSRAGRSAAGSAEGISARTGSGFAGHSGIGLGAAGGRSWLGRWRLGCRGQTFCFWMSRLRG